ncbi:MAG: hypothetical protein KKB13_27930, partial [Chloroflexi bacterium]|nr:hypothetical protein [Chloroflexota bacterium]MBU1877909.1 hypothetical protein [Chloroflexota bacterium]
MTEGAPIIHIAGLLPLIQEQPRLRELVETVRAARPGATLTVPTFGSARPALAATLHHALRR